MDILKDKAGQNIAKNISSLREKKNISQATLAKLAGTTRASIALLESGSANPTLDILLKISQGLKISIDELISHRAPSANISRPPMFQRTADPKTEWF